MAKTGHFATGDAHQSSNALFGAAFIHLLPGLLYWPLHGFNFDIADWIYAGGFALLVLLATWARRSPLVPSLICAILFCALLALQLPNLAQWNSITWILQVTLAVLIGIAVFSSFRQKRREPDVVAQS